MRKSGGIFVAIVVAIALLCGAGAWVQYRASQIELSSLEATTPTVVLAKDSKQVLGHIASADGNHKSLADNQVTTLVRHSFMAAEDRGFYTHGGVSWPGMAAAIITNARVGGLAAGGSTITQQYAKKYAGSDKTWERKVNEVIYARKIEQEFTKDQILVKYANTCYFGRGAYGVEDAAQTWFGVSATTLSKMDDPLQVARAAFLAALVKAPGHYEKYQGKPSNLTNADEIWDRTKYVLGGLRDLKGLPADQKMVTQEVVDKAKALLPLKLTDTMKNSGNVVDGDPSLMNYVVDWMKEWQIELAKADGLKGEEANKAGEAAAKEMLARGGLKIQLSIDSSLQAMAVKAHKERIASNTSAVVVIDPRDGGVLALSGSRDFGADQFNYAIYGKRPPGSTVKPFILADAVRKGISANSVFAAPGSIKIDGPPIENHGSGDAPGCKMTLAEALAASQNVVFVQAATGKMTSCEDRTKVTPIADYPVTLASTAKMLREAGAEASLIPGRSDPIEIKEEPRLGIGSGLLLSPLKLAVMGATLANGGTYHKPYLVASIQGPKGEIFKHKDESRRVLDEKHANIVNKAMMGVYTNGTAKNAQVQGQQLGGKTGTTDTQEGDSLFFGFNAFNPKQKNSAQRLCVAFETKNPRHSGADAARVCQHFFSNALKGKGVDFPEADLNSGKKVGLITNPPPPPPPPPTSEQPQPPKSSPPSSPTRPTPSAKPSVQPSKSPNSNQGISPTPTRSG